MALPSGITVSWFKSTFLGGVELRDRYGNLFLTDEAIAFHLEAAVSMVENELGVSLTPVTIDAERHDTDRSSRSEFYQDVLDIRPLRSLRSLKLKWGNNEPFIKVPDSWLHIRSRNSGEVEVIVDQSSAEFTMTVGWPFFGGPGMLGYNRSPAWFEYSYEAGFADGAIPYAILQVVGMVAAAIPLSIAGDLLFGSPGVRSRSISADGLSQSASAPDGYRLRVDGYARRVSEMMSALRAEFSPMSVRVF